MIPLLAVVRVHGPMRFRLWLPLFLIWILLLPFVLVLLPFALAAFVVHDRVVWPVMSGVLEVLSGIRGTHIEVSAPGKSVFVHIW